MKNLLGLLLVVIGLFINTWLFNIHKISNLPMGSYHTWRQADCISLTNNFYSGNASLFKPQTNYVKDDTSRMAAGEFPILNFFVARIYEISGQDESVYRLVVYIFYLLGMIFLFLLFREISNESFVSALLTLLISSGSILVYYAINFLPDVPALSLAIGGLYITVIAKKRALLGIYVVGIGLLTLASLMKLTMGILLVSMAIVLFVDLLMYGRKQFNLKALAFIFVSLVAIFIWYNHAYRLDHMHPPFVFLTETRSYWQTYYLERPLIWHDVVNRWLPQVMLPIASIFILVGGILGVFISNRVKTEWIVLATMVLGLSILFFLLLYRQFYLHDYLWVGLLTVPIVFCFSLLQWLGGLKNKYIRISIQLFLGILLILQVFQTKLILKERYFQFDNNLVFNQNLRGLKDQLSAHGINKSDLVISIPDPSPNISLVAMDQNGFTNYKERNKDSLGLMTSIALGAEYLVVSNVKEYEKAYLKPFLKYYIFDYKSIGVFDLRSFKQ
jgi:general stress protein CsbA